MSLKIIFVGLFSTFQEQHKINNAIKETKLHCQDLESGRNEAHKTCFHCMLSSYHIKFIAIILKYHFNCFLEY